MEDLVFSLDFDLDELIEACEVEFAEEKEETLEELGYPVCAEDGDELEYSFVGELDELLTDLAWLEAVEI